MKMLMGRRGRRRGDDYDDDDGDDDDNDDSNNNNNNNNNNSNNNNNKLHLREELLSITRPGYVDQSTKATPLIDHRHSSAESIHFAKHVRQLVSHFASTHPPRWEKIVSSVKTRLCEVVKCRWRGLMQVLIVLWGEILYL